MANDMSSATAPKSDQLNSDDLIGKTLTITITDVVIRGGEQPISVRYQGDDGKPWKPCKSMARVMMYAWGADAKAYAGKSLTLYRDPSVKWGGIEIGGIRISHMSHIDGKRSWPLRVTKGVSKMWTVEPLAEPQATTKKTVSDYKAEIDALKSPSDVLEWLDANPLIRDGTSQGAKSLRDHANEHARQLMAATEEQPI